MIKTRAKYPCGYLSGRYSKRYLEDSMTVYTYDGNSYDMMPCLISESKLQAAKTAAGICTGSKHKEQAFNSIAAHFDAECVKRRKNRPIALGS